MEIVELFFYIFGLRTYAFAIWFGIVDILAVNVLLGTTYISKFMEGNFP